MQPIEEYPEQKKQSHAMQEVNPKKNKQLPFNKCPTISFVKVAACHMCKLKNKLVYQCHRSYQATSCEKKFCFDCLVLIYKDNIIDNIQKGDSWRCPYIRKICRCKNCCLSRKQIYTILQIDPTTSVYSNLRTRIRKQGQQQQNEIEQQSFRSLLRQRLKKLMDFNGQLINKVNNNYHKLNQEEIRLYNHLIHSNLNVLNNVGTSMVVHQTLLPEE